MAGAQLNIIEKFPVDAITSCSDAFRITADLGAEMVYPEDQPPYAAQPLIKSQSDLDCLSKPDVLKKESRMFDRVLATKQMAGSAGNDCLVLGWVDMPFAEACSICGVSNFMMLLVENSMLAHKILEFATEIVIDFSLAQLETGAPMIGAGDASASLISAEQYQEFALPYEQRVVEAIRNAGGLTKLHICGNTTHILDDMIESGADLFNVDHLVDFDLALKKYSSKGKCFKGNLDPVKDFLQATPEQCAARSLELMRKAHGNRYMLSAGCEIPAATSDEVFDAFCRTPQLQS